MCGIAGLVADRAGPVPANSLVPVSRMLRHRGPDDFGALVVQPGRFPPSRLDEDSGMDADAVAVLCHRRLSILDTTSAGHQPMWSADGKVALVLNGEIYNFIELRRELEAFGCVFRTRSDTEVLLAAWRHWGRSVLTRLSGMFAFAVADFDAGTVTLVRDVFGIKPLYLAWQGSTLYFASEMKALMALPGSRWRLDAQQVLDYLALGLTDHGETTIVDGIQQVAAGSLVEIPIGNPRAAVTRVWARVSVPTLTVSDLSFDEAAARLRDLFIDSVRIHLRSDAPVGVALSGGVDSSSVALAIRQVLGAEAPISAFGYVADGGAPSEERWMDEVARAGALHLRKIRVSHDELTDELDRLLMAQDQPVASTSVYAQFRVFQAAANSGIKVMLDGQGADEYLAGYPTFVGARLASLLAARNYRQAWAFLSVASGTSGLGTTGTLLRASRLLVPRGIRPWLGRLALARSRPGWVNRSWFHAQDLSSANTSSAAGDRILMDYLIECLVSRSLPALLRYADRNSMANSVESRVPFLNTSLVEFVLSLPEEYILDRRGTTKAIFRRAMRGIVPDAVLDRRDKVGFITPQIDWLRAHPAWVKLAMANAAALPFIDGKALQRQWSLAAESRGKLPDSFWRALNLGRWTELNNLSVN